MAKPFYTVILDRPRRLRFSTMALYALEETLGRSINSLMPTVNEKGEIVKYPDVGIRETLVITRAGLLCEMPDVTLQQVAEMLDAAPDFNQACYEIGQAFGKSISGEDTKPGKALAAAPKDGIGTKSTGPHVGQE